MKNDSKPSDRITDLIEKHFAWKPNHFEKLTTGDIATASIYSNDDHRVFAKSIAHEDAVLMLEAERYGLELIRETNAIDVPNVKGLFSTGATSAVLFLESIETIQAATAIHNDILGRKLAKLHHTTKSKNFGLKKDNYIGILPQKNKQYASFIPFYITTRLEPQIQMAYDSSYLTRTELSLFNRFCNRLENLIPTEKASLIHGDLWNGNVLWTSDDVILIDPAVSYNHREMDLAMMQLFGGFTDGCFAAYAECYPLEQGWIDRIDIYQLYFLLVHLNIFGASYAPSVNTILKKYD